MDEQLKNKLIDSLPAPEKGIVVAAYAAAGEIQREYPERSEQDRIARGWLAGGQWTQEVHEGALVRAFGGVLEASK